MGDIFNEKIGQMFIIRLQGKEINSELIKLIKDYHIGGVSLYSNNYNSYEEMLNTINKLKEINSKYNGVPLFISIDQEGGRVNRLPKEFKNVLSAKKISIKEEYVKKAGDLTSYALNSLGINMNFAPVLDIQRFPDNHAIGNRCYGTDKESVSKNGMIIMNALKEKNIISVVKHFPGHGLTKSDSHFFLPVTYKDIKKVDDIYPFTYVINNGCDAIMTSHIMVKKMDKIYPTSLSKKIIKNYLIDELKYNGLIITDDIKMKAVNLLFGYKKSSYKALEAGNNLILIGANYQTIIRCINYIKTNLNEEVKENIVSSYEKIIKVKEKYNINDKQNKMINLDTFNKEVEELNNKVRESLIALNKK